MKEMRNSTEGLQKLAERYSGYRSGGYFGGQEEDKLIQCVCTDSLNLPPNMKR